MISHAESNLLYYLDGCDCDYAIPVFLKTAFTVCSILSNLIDVTSAVRHRSLSFCLLGPVRNILMSILIPDATAPLYSTHWTTVKIVYQTITLAFALCYPIIILIINSLIVGLDKLHSFVVYYSTAIYCVLVYSHSASHCQDKRILTYSVVLSGKQLTLVDVESIHWTCVWCAGYDSEHVPVSAEWWTAEIFGGNWCEQYSWACVWHSGEDAAANCYSR